MAMQVLNCPARTTLRTAERAPKQQGRVVARQPAVAECVAVRGARAPHLRTAQRSSGVATETTSRARAGQRTRTQARAWRAALSASSVEVDKLAGVSVVSASTGEEQLVTSLWGGEEVACVAFLTAFGDFDSFEVAQRLRAHLPGLQAAGVQVRAIGIGSTEAAAEFAALTGLPIDLIYADAEATSHSALGFCPGFARSTPRASVWSAENRGAPASHWWNRPALVEQLGMHPYWKLVVMCAGIGSPGTLQEVLRGYFGDRDAPEAMQRYPDVLPPFMAPLYGVLGTGYQRPFELATVRLVNMVRILQRWELLTPPDKELILQRGGALVFKGRDVAFRHNDVGILRYVDVELLVDAAKEAATSTSADEASSAEGASLGVPETPISA